MPSAPDRQTQIDTLVDHFKRPRHKGALEAPDATVPGGNPGCGDLVTMYARLDDEDRISELSFEGEGCTISQAAASIVTELAQGKTPAEVEEMSYEDLIDVLGREVVSVRPRCATLGLSILKSAIRDHTRATSARE